MDIFIEMILNSDTEILDAFEAKLQKLMESYNGLLAENSVLRRSIEDGRLREEGLQQQLDSLKSEYENLKHTKVLSVSGHDLDSTRKRVSGLVREIDRCIDMLKI